MIDGKSVLLCKKNKTSYIDRSVIHLISREEVFYKSWLVDHYVSSEQKRMYKQFGNNLTGYIDSKSTEIEDPCNHLGPFHDDKEELGEFAVLAYAGKNKEHYLSHRSTAFIRFFELLNIKHLYLIDALRYDWNYFPFSYHEKRDAFKEIVNQPVYSEAFEISCDALATILPLLHHSGRHIDPIIWFFSANTALPFAMFLCDDANFHSSFRTKDKEKIRSAASTSDLLIGGFELCCM